MDNVQAVPAFKDNYIWFLSGANGTAGDRLVAIVDPGDAAPVLQAVDAQGLTPAAILVTHHHNDHIGGIRELQARYRLPVYGPAQENIPHISHPLREGDRVELPGLPTLDVLEIPGHTAGHIAYAGEGFLFCGDTLFAGGCGRLFEGTAAQLYASLQKLTLLSDNTWIYCAHEYTLNNLNFALAVEPNNPVLQDRINLTRKMREEFRATVPSELKMEKLTNPFLRCHIPAVVDAAGRHADRPVSPGLETFAALRQWKDVWRG